MLSEMTTPLSILSDQTKNEAARLLTHRLKLRADGAIDDPVTWHGVALIYGIRVRYFYEPFDERGKYYPAFYPDMPGMIAINTAYTALEQCRAWVHELAHFLLHVWIPPQLPNAADFYCYSDDPSDARHDVARRVEDLIFGGE